MNMKTPIFGPDGKKLKGRPPMTMLTEAEKKSAIRSHLQFGMAKAEIARTLNVPESTFRGWVKRYSEEVGRTMTFCSRHHPYRRNPLLLRSNEETEEERQQESVVQQVPMQPTLFVPGPMFLPPLPGWEALHKPYCEDVGCTETYCPRRHHPYRKNIPLLRPNEEIEEERQQESVVQNVPLQHAKLRPNEEIEEERQQESVVQNVPLQHAILRPDEETEEERQQVSVVQNVPMQYTLFVPGPMFLPSIPCWEALQFSSVTEEGPRNSPLVIEEIDSKDNEDKPLDLSRGSSKSSKNQLIPEEKSNEKKDRKTPISKLLKERYERKTLYVAQREL